MNELLNNLAGLPLVFLANVVLGIEVGRRETYFSKDKLIKGLSKGLSLYVAIGLLVATVYFIPDLQVSFDGTNIGVVEALNLLILGGVLFYTVEVLKKIGKLVKGVEPKIDVYEDPGVLEIDTDEVELG